MGTVTEVTPLACDSAGRTEFLSPTDHFYDAEPVPAASYTLLIPQFSILSVP